MHRRRPAVVVVDDDNDSRSDLAQCLIQAGFRCVTTDTVRAALWYVRRLSPVAAVIALSERRERLRLAEWIGSHPSDITLVLTSAHDDAAGVTSLPHRGQDVVAPRSSAHILAAVRHAALAHGEAAACS
jgi:DNA-binding NtrC family response regulator